MEWVLDHGVQSVVMTKAEFTDMVYGRRQAEGNLENTERALEKSRTLVKTLQSELVGVLSELENKNALIENLVNLLKNEGWK